MYRPPYAYRPPPRYWYYRPYYARWWVHPWYRWTVVTTSVIVFSYATHAWVYDWTPPPRNGWTWVPGMYVNGYWVPGYWTPVAAAPAGYVYVPGHWVGDTYVEGYYRVESREGPWKWVEGYYLEDGTFVSGHWLPTSDPPKGYVWEPGVWDGKQWVGGFYRPSQRSGYQWVMPSYDKNGVYHAGYWKPLQENPGHVWIPGWYDGNQWVKGYWVSEKQYDSEDVQSWTPDQEAAPAQAEGPSGEGTEDQAKELPPLGKPVPVVTDPNVKARGRGGRGRRLSGLALTSPRQGTRTAPPRGTSSRGPRPPGRRSRHRPRRPS